MKVKSIIGALFLFLLSCQILAQEGESMTVLFVGNSYTYFWDLPEMVEAMAKSKNRQIVAEQSTAGGVNLGHHWWEARGLKTLQLIRENSFDAVILQDHSLRAIEYPDSLLKYGRLLGAEIKKTGAQPYVYMTWARAWDASMQSSIALEYQRLAEQTNARIAPIGLVWQRARELRPKIELYDEDGSHPSGLGAYLTACTFFALLTDQSPIGLSHQLAWENDQGKKKVFKIKSKKEALFCQQVVEQILREMPD